MPTVTVRPNSTISAGGTIVGGSPSRQAALSDNSDATYVEFTNSNAVPFGVGFPLPVLPAGGAWSTFRARWRARVSAGSGWTYKWQVQGSAAFIGNFVVPGTSFAEYASPPVAAPVAFTGALSFVDNGLPVGDIVSHNLRVAELYLDAVYATQPTTVVSAPTGTITTTSQPTIVFSYTQGTDGSSQSRLEAKIFSAAQYGAGGFSPDTSTPTWTSGVVASSATSVVPDLLPNAVYRAYVRTAQTINGNLHWSDWDFEGFTLSVTGPTVDSVVVADGGDHLQVTVSRDTGGEAWEYVSVERSIDAGTSWVWVRGATRAVVAGDTFIVDDREVPNGTTAVYRARGIRVVDDNDIAGEWVSSAAESWTSAFAWLRNPHNPTLDMTVVCTRVPQAQRDIRQGVFVPLGGKYPVVVSDRRQATAGGWTFQTSGASEAEDLVALVDSASQLLLQLPPNWVMPGLAGNLYMAPGRFTENAPANKATHPLRRFDLEYREIARPADLTA